MSKRYWFRLDDQIAEEMEAILKERGTNLNDYVQTVFVRYLNLMSEFRKTSGPAKFGCATCDKFFEEKPKNCISEGHFVLSLSD